MFAFVLTTRELKQSPRKDSALCQLLQLSSLASSFKLVRPLLTAQPPVAHFDLKAAFSCFPGTDPLSSEPLQTNSASA